MLKTDLDPTGTGIPFDINELAKEAGLKYHDYDTALMQPWYDDVHAKTGLWPQNYGFVWSYATAKTWGEPFPLTPQAKVLLLWYKAVSND